MHVQEEKRWIDRFIKFAKFWGVFPVEEDFGAFLVRYDGHWMQYKVKGFVEKCLVTEDQQVKALPECAKYCWKLPMFKKSQREVNEVVGLLLPLLKEKKIRSFKHDAERSIGTGAGYIIVLYAWGEKERDSLKERLQSLGFAGLECRRGCEGFEKKFGNWKNWFRLAET